MQMAEAIEKNENIIKNAHDTKLAGHQKVFKTLKKVQEKTTWKNIISISTAGKWLNLGRWYKSLPGGNGSS